MEAIVISPKSKKQTDADDRVESQPATLSEVNSSSELSTPSHLSPDKPGSNKPNPEKPSMIEVPLPGERYAEAVLAFKVPAWDTLLASANRRLKFEFPASRNVAVAERLLKTNGISAGLSKKVLEALPLAHLEVIYRALWQSRLGKANAIGDAWLSLFLLLEEMGEFDAKTWVLEDIRLLGQHDAGVVHSYYYKNTLSPDDMRALLSGHDYSPELVDVFLHDQPEEIALAYLICRQLSHPLPWVALLEQLSVEESRKYPRLARLKAIWLELSKQSWVKEPITPKILHQAVTQLQSWLSQETVQALGSRLGLTRPVKTLVIVEGETENLLLPLFAKAHGLDLSVLGIALLPAGGKNHVLSLYQAYAGYLNVPICMILDSDAADIVADVNTHRRKQDYVFQIQEGEFEDLYDLSLTIKAINTYYQPYPELTKERFRALARENKAIGRVQALKAIWQAYNLGSFDKVVFAGQYAELLSQAPRQSTPLPSAIIGLLEIILRVRNGLCPAE